ncbi:tetratricopeptide repeat protein [Actinosynnema sp. NPDC023587]|uniref:tetratricopeptide repeat protein n=1 Tax=Actinosynnema sp. NPDC023587 TaxID=3154695 RepID=UPI0033E730D8
MLVAAATGVVTNVLSDNWTLTWWLALGALAAASVVLQLIIAVPAQEKPEPGGLRIGDIHSGRDTHVAGRDMTVNHVGPDRGEAELELTSVTLADTGSQNSGALLDLKLRNTGGQPAILLRATVHLCDAVSLSPYNTVGFLPHDNMWVRGVLHVSHTYDVALPEPGKARGTRLDLELSQEIAPYGTDRFHIRLGIPGTQDTLLYLLRLDLHYNKDLAVSSPAITIAHPAGSRLSTIDEIREDLRAFRGAVRDVRHAVDRELAVRGVKAPAWDGDPPRRREDLPVFLLSLDGDPQDALGCRCGTYKVNEHFWNPEESIARRLDDIEAHYTQVTATIDGAEIGDDVLPAIQRQAKAVLAAFPALRAEFATPGTGQQDTWASQGTKPLDEAAELADKVRRLGPRHPEALAARETLIFSQVRWHKPGAAEALKALIPDQTQAYGPDDPRTLRARHYLAMCRGETGDARGAAADLVELVADRTRLGGAEHQDTLDSRSELARWRAMSGDPAAAAELFAELLEVWTKVGGPDHPRTLHTRKNLTTCLKLARGSGA